LRILMIKLKHIGDTLLMTPAIRFLRQQFPESKIYVVVRRGCEEILEGNPDIDGVLGIAHFDRAGRSWTQSLKELVHLFQMLRGGRFDYAFDLSDSDRAKWIIFLTRARHRVVNRWHARLGWKEKLYTDFSDFAWGREHMVKKDFRTVADLFDPTASPGPLVFKTTIMGWNSAREKLSLEPEKFIVFHPTTRWSFKGWLPERWAQLADWTYQQLGFSVLFSCGPNPKEKVAIEMILRHAKSHHYATWGRLSLHELGCVLEKAKLFVGIDSAAMHLAAAVGCPVVALFGPSSEWSWHPWHCHYEIVLGRCECKKTRKFVCDKSRPYPCMEDIGVERVVGAITSILSIEVRQRTSMPKTSNKASAQVYQ